MLSKLRYDWSTMFQAFTEVPVSESIQQALFQSWCDYIVRCAKPRSYYLEFQGAKTVDNWWLHWLIDSIADSQKGKTWFQEKITSWLTNLPLDKAELGEEYNLLRLLTFIFNRNTQPNPKSLSQVLPSCYSTSDIIFS